MSLFDTRARAMMNKVSFFAKRTNQVFRKKNLKIELHFSLSLINLIYLQIYVFSKVLKKVEKSNNN